MKTKRNLNGDPNRLSKWIVAPFIPLLGMHFAMAQPQMTIHVFEDWAVTSGTQNFFYRNVSKTDGSGNVYIAGATLNGSGNYDILVRKYNSSGATLWTSQYAGAAGLDDIAADIYIDGSGNVFVTGAAAQNAGDSQDLILIKYNSSGTQQWVSFYNNPSGSPVKYDGGTSIDMDGSGNIYVGGGSVGNGTGSDYVTLKFNSSGVQQSVQRYDYNGNDDIVTKIHFNTSNSDVVVSGASQRSSTRWDFATVSYHLLSVPTVVRSSGTIDGIDAVADMQIDASGNIYITGTSKNIGTEYDFKTVKLNSSMVEQWSVVYDGAAHLDDRSNAVRVDNSGNVYVTGYTTHATQGRNYATIKYNSSGTQQWIQYHNGAANGDDEGNALVVDNSGNVYVTGQSTTADNLDYYTIKYDGSGTKIWETGYNGVANGGDKAAGISLDGSGGIVISGQTETAPNTYSYTTVRYIESSLYEIPNGEAIPLSFECVQNRGQLIHPDNSPAEEVKYYTGNTEPALYFQAKKVSMLWAKSDSSNTDTLYTDTLHRVDMVMGSGKSNNGFGLNSYEWYHNYYFSYCPDGIENVKGFNTIVYPDMYSNVDVYYTANNRGIKTQFVVKPGGAASAISVRFDGANSVGVNGSGDLDVTASIGAIEFKRARAFQIDSLGNEDTLSWQPSYSISGGDILSFSSIGSYDPTLPLILEMFEAEADLDEDDANLTWSTYYGASLYDAGASVKTDAEGNVFVYGGTTDVYFPATFSLNVGSVMSEFAFLLKFDENRLFKWATLFGKSHLAINPSTEGVTENIKDMAIDNEGQIYFCGTLAYDIDFPEITLPGAYESNDVSLVNGRASYIGRANNTFGYLDWAQLFVGTQRKLLFNETGELYMVGEGGDNSTNTGLPLQNPGGGAYYNETGYGTITKFGTNHSVVYCTRIASETGSSLSAIAPGPDNSVYVGGYSQNSNFPETASGTQYTQAYTTSAEGSSEGILFQLGATDEILWATYMGGSHREIFNAAASSPTDAPDFRLCLVGWTNSSDFPTEQGSAGTFQSTNLNADTSNREAIILLFDDGNSLLYSSYYGSPYDEALNAITATPDGRFFMGGYTKNLSISTVPYGIYYDQSHNGRSDALVLGILGFGDLFWTTCFGGNGSEQIHGMAMIGNNRLFATGQTSARNNPSGEPFPTQENASPGAYFDGDPGTTSSNYNVPDAFIMEVSVMPELAIFENEVENSPSLYPNPTSGVLNLFFGSASSIIQQIDIIDLTGRTIQSQKFTGTSYIKNIVLDVSNLKPGIYMLRVMNGGTYKTIKFIRQ